MQAFLFRSLALLLLFFLGAFGASLTAHSYLAIPFWFIAITAWTHTLGFRKALFIVIPFLLFADVLWDGKIGELFLGGFLLATATTYLAVRIETRSQMLQWAGYSFLVATSSTVVVWISLAWPNEWLAVANLPLAGKIFLWQFGTTIIFYPLLSRGIQKLEAFLDNSYREQIQKIR